MFTAPEPVSAAGRPLPAATVRRPLSQLPNAGEKARKASGCLGFLAALRAA